MISSPLASSSSGKSACPLEMLDVGGQQQASEEITLFSMMRTIKEAAAKEREQQHREEEKHREEISVREEQPPVKKSVQGGGVGSGEFGNGSDLIRCFAAAADDG